MSLKTKMAVTVLVLVTTMVSVMGIISITCFIEVIKKTVAQQQYALVTNVAKDIDDKFITARNALTAVAGMLSAEVAADPEKAQLFLDARVGTRTIFGHGLILLSMDGRVVAESPYYPARRGTNLASRNYFRKTVASGKPFIAETIESSRPGHQLVITITVPVFDSAGKMIGVLGGGLEIMNDNLLGKISRTMIGKTGYLYLFSTDRTMIMHPEQKRIMKRDFPPGVDKLLDKAIQGFDGSGATVNSRGIPMFTSFKHLASTNWIVGGNYPLTEMYAPIDEAKTYIIAAMVVVCSCSVLLVYLLMKRLTAPLFRLTKHVAELHTKEGTGRFFSADTADEIGTLAETFNCMVIELEKRQEEVRESKELYQIVADFSADMATWLSPDGEIRYVSPQCRLLTGYREEEFYLDSYLLDNIIHPDDRQIWLEHKEETESDHHERPLEFRIITKSGETRWVSHLCRRVYGDSDEFRGVRGSFSDITERKHTEHILRANREELIEKHENLESLFKQVEVIKLEWEATMDSIGEMIILADNMGRIKRCNKAFLEFTGEESLNLVDRDWKKLLFDHGLKARKFFVPGMELFHDQSKRWFVFNAYPFADSTGYEISGIVITINDTTELKRTAEELGKAYTELKAAQAQMLQTEKMASIGQLAAGVAHEINNPIGFVSSNLGTLEKYVRKMVDFIDAQSEKLGSINVPEIFRELEEKRKGLKLDFVLEDIDNLIRESVEGTNRVRKIVQDLKTFSRVDEAENKIADINQCLESTINIAWNEIKYKAVMKKEFGVLPQIKCYPQQLNQVFMNLLVNAAHAIEQQGEITVRSWHDEDIIHVSISDTGRGMTTETQNRIFEPFFTTKEVGKGTGLGLSISYDIIKKHRGEISVLSEIGNGTTFTVSLPVAEGG